MFKVSKKYKHKPICLVFFMPGRCISKVFEALASIALIFAECGPGLMPENKCQTAEQAYLCYRENYNSYQRNISTFCFGKSVPPKKCVCYIKLQIFHLPTISTERFVTLGTTRWETSIPSSTKNAQL